MPVCYNNGLFSREKGKHTFLSKPLTTLFVQRTQTKFLPKITLKQNNVELIAPGNLLKYVVANRYYNKNDYIRNFLESHEISMFTSLKKRKGEKRELQFECLF